MNSADDLPICTACGMQYEGLKERCPVCEDPRQFIPAPGQQWTTLRELRKEHRNKFELVEGEKHVWNVYTEPKFAIGQRAMLIETPAGLVLWDLISLVDEETEKFIKSKGNGKLSAIVISHPHFYTTNRYAVRFLAGVGDLIRNRSVWSKVFDCPVYVAPEDLEWLFTKTRLGDNLRLLQEVNTQIVDKVTAIKCGGHFAGSTCLHWDGRLFHSDTVFAIASSRNPPGYRDENTHAFSFLWSIPNSIPLDPATIHQIWSRLKPFEFEASFGNLIGADARDKNLKKRLLASAKTQVTMMGWKGKPEGQLVLDESVA